MAKSFGFAVVMFPTADRRFEFSDCRAARMIAV